MAQSGLAWLEELDEEDHKDRFRLAFQRVVATEDGAIVFLTIFHQLYFFRKVEDAEQQALNNYAKELARIVGGEQVFYRIVEAIIGGQKSGNKQG